jgi:hypothetical protein
VPGGLRQEKRNEDREREVFERVHFLYGMENGLADMVRQTPKTGENVGLVLGCDLAYLCHALQLGCFVDVVKPWEATWVART